MASMSYCMFENTEQEMLQCIAAMDQAGCVDDLDMNEYERAAFMRMWKICREFLAEHERILNAEVSV